MVNNDLKRCEEDVGKFGSDSYSMFITESQKSFSTIEQKSVFVGLEEEEKRRGRRRLEKKTKVPVILYNQQQRWRQIGMTPSAKDLQRDYRHLHKKKKEFKSIN